MAVYSPLWRSFIQQQQELTLIHTKSILLSGSYSRQLSNKISSIFWDISNIYLETRGGHFQHHKHSPGSLHNISIGDSFKDILVVRSDTYVVQLLQMDNPGIGMRPKLLICGCSDCQSDQLVSTCGRNSNLVADNSSTFNIRQKVLNWHNWNFLESELLARRKVDHPREEKKCSSQRSKFDHLTKLLENIAGFITWKYVTWLERKASAQSLRYQDKKDTAPPFLSLRFCQFRFQDDSHSSFRHVLRVSDTKIQDTTSTEITSTFSSVDFSLFQISQDQKLDWKCDWKTAK